MNRLVRIGGLRVDKYSYDKIDRFLRNNLDDTDYAEYSSALDDLLCVPSAMVSAIREGSELLESPAATDADFDRLGERFRGLLAVIPDSGTTPQPLTIQQLNDCAKDAQIDFCMDKASSFEVAFARRIEAAHGIKAAAAMAD